MSQTLKEIAKKLNNTNKKVNLIYAFNGTGKTRLSREFKDLISPKNVEESDQDNVVVNFPKILYYNAFTEDLFYWNNDLELDQDRRLIIQPNAYTDWVLIEQGQEPNITRHFQRYTNDKLTPKFNEEYSFINDKDDEIIVPAFSEVRFSFERGNDQEPEPVKISKGEESCFIWSVFYSLLEDVINTLNETDLTNRSTDKFNDLEYIFIDDPVSSLDDNHLIELAVNIANLIKSSESDKLKFIITTHNPLFYNVLSNEFNNKYPNKNENIKNNEGQRKKWLYEENHSLKHNLKKLNDGNYKLTTLGRNTPFSYHLSLLVELQNLKEVEQVQKYHFNFLRNILEKTATFLGYPKWEKLLPKLPDGLADPFAERILNLSSHSAHAGEEIAEVQENDKAKFLELISFLETEYKFSNLILTNATV